MMTIATEKNMASSDLNPIKSADRIAVVIPAFRSTETILDVISGIGPEVGAIYVVDDACPENTGQLVSDHSDDPRVQVIRRKTNGGVGAATITGIKAALEGSAVVIVKIDSDGQMDPSLIPTFCRPILAHEADFTKGNRFFNLEDVRSMPIGRLLGNAVLSFFNKASTGYWSVFDPTNGYLAIHRNVANYVPWDRLAERYFFESDLLFRLGTLQAVIRDIPMRAVYGNETSGVNPVKEILPFLGRHLRNFLKRIFYTYFLRSFSTASLELLAGVLLLVLGSLYGLSVWSWTGEPTNAGTVMLVALPVFVGFTLLLSFLNFDMSLEPKVPVHTLLASSERNAEFSSLSEIGSEEYNSVT